MEFFFIFYCINLSYSTGVLLYSAVLHLISFCLRALSFPFCFVLLWSCLLNGLHLISFDTVYCNLRVQCETSGTANTVRD
jgi:hypothetical protein